MSEETHVIVIHSEDGRYMSAVLSAFKFDEGMEPIIGKLNYEWDVISCDLKVSWLDYVLTGLNAAGYEVSVYEYEEVKL